MGKESLPWRTQLINRHPSSLKLYLFLCCHVSYFFWRKVLVLLHVDSRKRFSSAIHSSTTYCVFFMGGRELVIGSMSSQGSRDSVKDSSGGAGDTSLHYCPKRDYWVPVFKIIGPSSARNHTQLLLNIWGLDPTSLHSTRSTEG